MLLDSGTQPSQNASAGVVGATQYTEQPTPSTSSGQATDDSQPTTEEPATDLSQPSPSPDSAEASTGEQGEGEGEVSPEPTPEPTSPDITITDATPSNPY